jgi:DUF4097 and DUF4098 domain-containing protein YvlB
MIERTFQIPLPLELEVSIPSGDIDVTTVDGEESTIVVDADERVLEHVEVRHDGSRILVTMRKVGFSFSLGSLFGDGGIRVRASVPHGASLKTKTASADLEITGRVRALELNTVSGDVRLRGEVEEGAAVKTVSGDVELDRVGGSLSLQSVSGDLRSGPVGGSVDTKSVSGDIRLESLSSGDVRFSSVSGDVEVGIAQGSLLDVDAGSTSGDLGSEVPLASEPDGETGDGPTVVLRGRTVSGDVRVFRAG